jgi:hypothetical protein
MVAKQMEERQRKRYGWIQTTKKRDGLVHYTGGSRGKGKSHAGLKVFLGLANLFVTKQPAVAQIPGAEMAELFEPSRKYQEQKEKYERDREEEYLRNVEKMAKEIEVIEKEELEENHSAPKALVTPVYPDPETQHIRNPFAGTSPKSSNPISVIASGGGGGGSGFYSYDDSGNGTPPRQPIYNEIPPNSLFQRQWQQGWGYFSPTTTSSTTSGIPNQETPQESKKQEFTAEDWKGKFCAVATITHNGVIYRGVLFVRKCGHWKLLDFNGNRLTGGTSGSFDGLLEKGQLKVEVHSVIYDAEPKPESPDKEFTLGADDLEIV